MPSSPRSRPPQRSARTRRCLRAGARPPPRRRAAPQARRRRRRRRGAGEGEQPLGVLRTDRMTLAETGDSRAPGSRVRARSGTAPARASTRARAHVPPSRRGERAPGESSAVPIGRASRQAAVGCTAWTPANSSAGWTTTSRPGRRMTRPRSAALFSEDARYRYHPWDEGDDVVEGRDGYRRELARRSGRAWLVDSRVPPVGDRR